MAKRATAVKWNDSRPGQPARKNAGCEWRQQIWNASAFDLEDTWHIMCRYPRHTRGQRPRAMFTCLWRAHSPSPLLKAACLVALGKYFIRDAASWRCHTITRQQSAAPTQESGYTLSTAARRLRMSKLQQMNASWTLVQSPTSSMGKIIIINEHATHHGLPRHTTWRPNTQTPWREKPRTKKRRRTCWAAPHAFVQAAAGQQRCPWHP